MKITSFGAAGEVTGSCHLVEAAKRKILLDCGLLQGRSEDEKRNAEPFPFAVSSIDAVILSHAHIDHSGRIPYLIKSGYEGTVYTHGASRDLCRILLKDSAFIQEKDAEWDSKKRLRKGLEPVEPLYTVQDAQDAMRQFKTLHYDKRIEIVPGISVCLRDAGHILGSAIVELWAVEDGIEKKVVFSGDLGHRDAPILRDPTVIGQADAVLMESTYGDRLHRDWQATFDEMAQILTSADESKGNILIPAFAVGRTQELLYLFSKNYKSWQMNRWQIFLDSPMAIETTAVYARHSELYDKESKAMYEGKRRDPLTRNLHFSRTTNQSMQINKIQSGAIIIAGSGMCTGGRIKHHIKHHIWRRGCHLLIIGYQGANTLGRKLVDGAKYIKLWGEEIRVAADVHTVGGLSAHADQQGLLDWYGGFQYAPPVYLVHGEQQAQQILAQKIAQTSNAKVHIMKHGESIEIT